MKTSQLNHTQCWKKKSFKIKSLIIQWYIHSPLLFNIVLEVLAKAIRQEEKVKAPTLENKETIPGHKWHEIMCINF